MHHENGHGWPSDAFLRPCGQATPGSVYCGIVCPFLPWLHLLLSFCGIHASRGAFTYTHKSCFVHVIFRESAAPNDHCLFLVCTLDVSVTIATYGCNCSFIIFPKYLESVYSHRSNEESYHRTRRCYRRCGSTLQHSSSLFLFLSETQAKKRRSCQSRPRKKSNLTAKVRTPNCTCSRR